MKTKEAISERGYKDMTPITEENKHTFPKRIREAYESVMANPYSFVYIQKHQKSQKNGIERGTKKLF